MSKNYDFIGNIKEELGESIFSVRYLSKSRFQFQYGGYDDEDRKTFKNMLTERYFEVFPEGTVDEAEVFYNSCCFGGLNLKDIICANNSYFEINYDGYKSNSTSYIDYLYSTDSFRYVDYALIDFRATGLTGVNLQRLLDNLNYVYNLYYGCENFPDDAYYIGGGYTIYDSILSVSLEELCEAYLNKKNFSFSILGCIYLNRESDYIFSKCSKEDFMKHFTIRRVDLTYNIDKDVFDVVNVVDNDYELLSDRVTNAVVNNKTLMRTLNNKR